MLSLFTSAGYLKSNALYSEDPELEPFHGRAVRLFADDSRMPFHGAFLIHEMRVRGFWPFVKDRPISLPIPWQTWIQSVPGFEKYQDNGNGEGGGGDNDDDDNGDYNNLRFDSVMREGNSFPSDVIVMPPSSTHNPPTTSNKFSQQKSFQQLKPAPEPLRTNAALYKTLILTNPFANHAELEALRRSFTEQPNWKAAVVGGKSWEGTAEENIGKWRGLFGPVRALE